ncbi:MAG TPA: CinA family protein [Candidatus Scatomonas merdavium]|nr:CinA family protein [Candidatus Scatomonas merdavium]
MKRKENCGEAAEERLVEELLKRNWLVTTVESCTGGMVSSRIVNVPGASEVLREAYVTYCDEAKMKLVGVRKETLEKYTAVSARTAEEMALGGLAAAEADMALSVTGLAGPGGGTKERPVGLVYVGCAIHGQTFVRELHLSGSRQAIREQAAEEALRLALTAFA